MGFVKLEKQGHVGIVTIDRQEALNALNSQVLSDLDAVIDQVAADDEIYVMIADAQALTDNADNPEKVRQNVLQVARRQEVRRARRRRVPQAGEPVQARDCGGKRLRPGRRL